MIWLNTRRLGSSSSRTRRKAIECLTAPEGLHELRMLIASLGDPDAQVRCAAARALDIINAELSVAARAKAQAEAIPEAQAIVATTLNDVHDSRRSRSRRKSATNVEPTACPEATASPDPNPGEFQAAALLDKLADPDANARLAAAQALEQQANPAHLTHFLTLLADDHFEVRLTAIQYLGRLGDPATAQALIARLADPDDDVRRAAAGVLGTIRNPVALEPLVLSLTDEEAAVRHAAAAALEQIEPRWVRTNAAQRALPRLEALRKDPRPWIAAAAEKVIQALRAAKSKDTELWKRESGIRKL